MFNVRVMPAYVIGDVREAWDAEAPEKDGHGGGMPDMSGMM